MIFQLVQMAFFGLAAVNDLQPGKEGKGFLSRFKDLLFSVFAFPVGMVRNPFFHIQHYLTTTIIMLDINSVFPGFSLVCRSTFLGNLCL